jgi:hypothetical protein
MHELLAPLVYVLYCASSLDSYVSSVKSHLIRRPEETLLSSIKHIEHDAYVLFEKVMEVTVDWFRTKPKRTDDEGEDMELVS